MADLVARLAETVAEVVATGGVTGVGSTGGLGAVAGGAGGGEAFFTIGGGDGLVGGGEVETPHWLVMEVELPLAKSVTQYHLPL